jgi:hypothetical protein
MKRKLFISTVVASLIMGSISLFANEVTTAPSLKVVEKNQTSKRLSNIQNSISNEVKVQKKSFKEASKEIKSGLHQTFIATRALENKKIDKAKKALSESVSLFEKALKAEPTLGLIPIAQEITIHSFEGSAKEVGFYIDKTVALLKKHDTQQAKAMLMPLEDEMVIATQRFPIDGYLASTKDALKLLDANKTDEALSTLVTGLSLMEIDVVVMPIPLMVAEDLIIEASLLDKSKKDEAEKLLTMAQDELEKGVLLGYTQKHSPEYKLLSDGIVEIQKEIKGKNMVEKLYDKLKENFHSLMTKSREDVVKHKAEEKVHNYQKREEEKAVSETATFQSDAKADENKTIK